MSSVDSQLIGMQNATNITQAQAQKAKGTTGSNTIDSNAFMTLLLQQLKYQDPLNPTDNQQFLAQQAQFTQLSEIQKLNSNTSTNNQIMQASSLIGKTVTLVDPNDTSKKITGKVTSADFTSSGAAIEVNGKSYALGYVSSISDGSTTSTTTPTNTTTNNSSSGSSSNSST